MVNALYWLYKGSICGKRYNMHFRGTWEVTTGTVNVKTTIPDKQNPQSKMQHK